MILYTYRRKNVNAVTERCFEKDTSSEPVRQIIKDLAVHLNLLTDQPNNSVPNKSQKIYQDYAKALIKAGVQISLGGKPVDLNFYCRS